MPKIAVIGSTNTDLVVKTPRFPAPGETVIGTDFQIFPGGKGANQAVSISRLGTEVCFITKLGRDDFGRRACENIQANGIATNYVLWDEEHPSGVALIEVDQNGQNCIVIISGANNHLLPEDIHPLEEVISACQLILLQLEIPITTVECVLQLAAKHYLPVVLNPAPAKDVSRKLFQYVTYLTPNETEAEILAGIAVNDRKGMQLAAKKLLHWGSKVVIITLGEQGVYFNDGANEGIVPGCKVTTVDTTAAGDVFNAALAVAITQKNDLSQAIRFANAGGALATTKMGAQPSLPRLDEVQRLVAQGSL